VGHGHRHEGEIAIAVAEREFAALLGRTAGTRDPDRVRPPQNQRRIRHLSTTDGSH
jgi:hypothetical protein